MSLSARVNDFVSLMLQKPFYEEFERDSLKLGVSTEISALKALEDYHEKMKKALALKKVEEGGEAKMTGEDKTATHPSIKLEKPPKD